MQTIFLIGTGGFIGANLRYFVSTVLTRTFTKLVGISVPFGTLFVNVSGSLLLAVFTVWLSRRMNMSDSLRLMIGTGFFGAYTTFSTFANESINLSSSEGWGTAILYILATNLLCLIGVVIGLWLSNRLFPLN